MARDRAHDLGRERAGISRIVESDIVDRDPARAKCRMAESTSAIFCLWWRT
jgi:hypothetical protein